MDPHVFLISSVMPQQGTSTEYGTHNIHFSEEIRKNINTFLLKKSS